MRVARQSRRKARQLAREARLAAAVYIRPESNRQPKRTKDHIRRPDIPRKTAAQLGLKCVRDSFAPGEDFASAP